MIIYDSQVNDSVRTEDQMERLFSAGISKVFEKRLADFTAEDFLEHSFIILHNF